jgi:hypothetical protein
MTRNMVATVSDASEAPETRVCKDNKAQILVLSTSLLTDRVLLYTQFLNRLDQGASVTVWANSVRLPQQRELWRSSTANIEEFPHVRPFREFPYNFLRRLNEFVWDYRQRPPSRLSMWKHIRSRTAAGYIQALRAPARALAMLRAERALESGLDKLLLSYRRSPEAEERIKSMSPDVVITTGPFQFEQPAIAATARNLGIPVVALIPSWDNVSTKHRMVFKYDGFIVWSDQTKRDLHRFYPDSREVPTYVVGAAQFDVFFQKRFHVTREEFCADYGLRPELPIVVYAVGSPNFLKEHHGALDMAARVARNELGDVQMIVRPHPLHDNGAMESQLREFYPRVVLQRTAEVDLALSARSQDENQIKEWVNTFRHADVVINLSSTVAVDAAILDKPVVNLDYDPEPGQPNQALVKDVNHTWTHFKPIAESGGVWLVNSPEETVEAVKTYLSNPGLHREKRKWIAGYVCQHLDGHSGERMAEAMLDFTNTCAKVRTFGD